jgi:Na+-translocating ferredoxin:NAD+ oxidoreductase RnfA subunit
MLVFRRALSEDVQVDMGRLNVIHASAIGLGACAIAALVFPGALLRGLGVPDDTIAIMGVIRLSGVLLLALASVLWSARFWLLSPLGASTLRTLAVIYGIGAVMLIAQQMAASRLLESTVPILYMSLLAFEYAGTARRFSKRWGAPA